jgi:hypothetical protein
MYSDRPSKINGAPCCHLDFRIYGAEQCRRYGFTQVGDLRSIELQRQVILRGCRLSIFSSTFSPELIEARIERMVNRMMRRYREKSREELTGRVWNIVARSVSQEDQIYTADTIGDAIRNVPIQEWIDCNPLVVKNAVVSIPSSALLGHGFPD